jgi:hypothetical protein
MKNDVFSEQDEGASQAFPTPAHGQEDQGLSPSDELSFHQQATQQPAPEFYTYEGLGLSSALPSVVQADEQSSSQYSALGESDLGLSGAIPGQGSNVNWDQVSGGLAPTVQPARHRGRRLLFVIVIVVLLIILVPTFALAFFSGSVPHLGPTTTNGGNTTTVNTAPVHTPVVRPTATAVRATPTAAVSPTASASPTAKPPVSWMPATLPPGWTQAGLSMEDVFAAEHTGYTFTEREEHIDFQSVGTQGNPGGTLTAAKFLLDPAAVARFNQNDRRSSAAFFALVQQQQLEQSPINLLPQLVGFQVQGNNQFAWIQVSFQLYIQHGVGNQGALDTDQATGQPRMHQMMVLLIHVQKGTPNAAMGGIGWLVSSYALDQQGMLPIPANP